MTESYVHVNRRCGSALDAAITASRAIEAGEAEVVPTGGAESMSRAPWVLPKPERAYPAGDLTAVSSMLGRRLVNERMPREWTVPPGEANEQPAERFPIPRQRQDEFALRSHELADAAWRSGLYDESGLPVPVDDGDATLHRDEGIRPISAVELNEAYAVQAPACVDAWGTDPETVNTKENVTEARP